MPLRAKSFALLRLLVENAGTLVAREAIMEALWPSLFVTDDNITQCIVDIRRGLGTEARQILRTVPRRGYLFAAPVTVQQPSRSPALPLNGDRIFERHSPGDDRLLADPAETAIRSPQRDTPASPSRLSIAVLAFANLSDDPHQEYLSDGVADDFITELARNRSLFVVARTSSFSYKRRLLDVKQIARELGVRYVVDGSVRRDCDRVRITAQLIDAETGGHVWAERFDRDLADFFGIQDQVIQEMVAAIDPAISEVECPRLRRTPDSFSAWEAWQRALWYWSKGSDLAVRRHFLNVAMALDPRFPPAHAMLVWLYLSEATRGGSWPLREAIKLAEGEARVALDLDPESSIAHAALAWVFDHQGDPEAALNAAETAISLNPNDPQGHLIKGHVLGLSGQPTRARESLATALRLDPRGPTAPAVMHNLAVGCYLEPDYGAAEATGRRSTRDYPEHPRPYLWLTATLGQLGRAEEASLALDATIRLSPNYLK